MSKCQCFYQLYKGDSASKPPCSCFNENIGREYICPKNSVTPGSANMGKLTICQRGGSSAEDYNKDLLQMYNRNPNCGIMLNNDVHPQPYCNPPGFMESFGLCPEKDQSGPYNYNIAALGYTLMPSPKYLANPYNVPDQNGGACTASANGSISVNASGNIVNTANGYLSTNKCPPPGYISAVNPHSQSNYRDICCGKLRCGNGAVSGIYPPGECGIETSYKIPQSYNRFRSYGSDEVPGFYYDLSAPHIANQAVYGQGNQDLVPQMLLVNQTNLPDRCFDCTQPIWGNKCI